MKTSRIIFLLSFIMSLGIYLFNNTEIKLFWISVTFECLFTGFILDALGE